MKVSLEEWGGERERKLKISPGKVVEVGRVKVKVSPEWEMESKGFT